MPHRGQAGKPVGTADDLAAIGEDVGQAARHRHHGQGGDEGGQPGAGDEQSRDQAADQTAEDGGGNRQAQRPADAQQHHGKGQHRAHRQVDAADDDDQGHADGQDTEHGYLVEDVEGVAHGEEILRGKGEHGDQQRQADQRAADVARQAQGQTGEGLGGWRGGRGFGVHALLLRLLFLCPARLNIYACLIFNSDSACSGWKSSAFSSPRAERDGLGNPASCPAFYPFTKTSTALPGY